MTDAGQARIKPTILIGYDSFGREVLERLLSNTAPRGNLEWELSPRGDSVVGEHRLRDLALLWMPAATLHGSGGDHRHFDAGSRADFIVDLHRQIQDVENRPGEAEQALAEAVLAAHDRLLLAETVQRRGGGIAGIDVIVIAHVSEPAGIGMLDKLIKALLKQLVRANPRYKDARPNKRTLNCIEILDFDNLRGAGAKAVRRALQRSMTDWKQQLGADRPALDRCWLVDGRARGEVRDLKSRYDEVTLFLELLLFGGQRDDVALRELYQQTNQDQQIAATFGIRLMERSPTLLSRIAAARFAEGWLPYLRGDPATGFHRAPRHLNEALEPLLAAAGAAAAVPAAAGKETGLEASWQQSVTALADALLALPHRGDEDWSARARQLFTERVRVIERDLQRAGLSVVRQVRETHLRDGGRALEEAVTGDLHDSLEPVPLDSVIGRIDEVLATLKQPRGGQSGGAPQMEPARTLAAHRAFRAEHDEWISGYGRGLARFWPVLAGVLALGITPFFRQLVQGLPLLAPPQSDWHAWLEALVTWLERPAILAPLLFVLTWLLLRALVQPRLTRSILRARDFFLDERRGRLHDAVLADCAALRVLLEQVRVNVRASLASDLNRLLTDIRIRLGQRRGEVAWLRRQLREFLRMQGVHADSLEICPPDNSVHLQVVADDGQDLERLLGLSAPGSYAPSERYKNRQEALPRPFDGWEQPYCDAFLDLFGFVDRLGTPYQRKFHDAVSDAERAPEWALRLDRLQGFLNEHRHDKGVSLALTLDADKAESADEVFCVLPASWKDRADVRQALHGIGIGENGLRAGSDPARLYLLRRRVNIAPEALEASP